jgi:hypothetical protein
LIFGCKRQLLRCYGAKTQLGSAMGCAEEGHVLCAPCLERWYLAQNALRAEKGLSPLIRRSCPVCKVELRLAAGEVRTDATFTMGLPRVAWSWPSAPPPKRGRV